MKDKIKNYKIIAGLILIIIAFSVLIYAINDIIIYFNEKKEINSELFNYNINSNVSEEYKTFFKIHYCLNKKNINEFDKIYCQKYFENLKRR